MKKILLPALALGALILSLSACTKSCNTCSLNGSSTEYCQGDFTPSQVDAFRNTCVNNGGTWRY